MKIDILFFNEEFTNKEEFISDSDLFNEYINTHLFDGKSKDILLMPPSPLSEAVLRVSFLNVTFPYGFML